MPEPLPQDRAVGLRLIIVYKLVKAAVQGALAIALLLLGHSALTARLADFTLRASRHVEHAWTAALARTVAKLLTPNHLALASLALALDAGLSAVEGWALERRYRWAPWLVVFASGSLIPFELFELARRVRVGRALVLVLNLAIIAYLLRRARAHRASSA
jgi:uncharacterized membrane protein (DUF2068 family)